jgi:N-acetyltransferase 10
MSLLAGRGRGKSAALGLAIAGAIAERYTLIYVTAPTPENLQTFFEFVLIGLEHLGYKQHTHYEIVKGSGELRASIVKIKVFREFHQVIQYITPNEKLAHAELLVIDEAAALPLPIVNALFGNYLTLISSTIHGYEGTGRSLSLKLLNSMKNLKQLTMDIPIRYSANDPVEKWLNDLLCL